MFLASLIPKRHLYLAAPPSSSSLAAGPQQHTGPHPAAAERRPEGRKPARRPARCPGSCRPAPARGEDQRAARGFHSQRRPGEEASARLSPRPALARGKGQRVAQGLLAQRRQGKKASVSLIAPPRVSLPNASPAHVLLIPAPRHWRSGNGPP